MSVENPSTEDRTVALRCGVRRWRTIHALSAFELGADGARPDLWALAPAELERLAADVLEARGWLVSLACRRAWRPDSPPGRWFSSSRALELEAARSRAARRARRLAELRAELELEGADSPSSEGRAA